MKIKNTSKLILQDQHYTDIKTRGRHYRKRKKKLPANIYDKHSYNNCQKDNSKQFNSTLK